MNMQTYNSANPEYDSIYGTNTFSVQLNTNQWAANSNYYSVQFTVQNYPGVSYKACIWEWVSNYLGNTQTHKCATIAQQALYTGYLAIINGSVSGGRIYTWGVVYLSNGGYTSWSFSTGDNVSLSTNWNQATGNLLGLGQGSEAILSYPTTQYTRISVWPGPAALRAAHPP